MRNGQKRTRRRWRRGCCACAPSQKTSRSACADRLLDAVVRIDKPQTHIEAACAQRCVLTMQTLLRQLCTTSFPSEPRRYEDKDFPILFRDWDDATGRDIWEIIAATRDEQQDFDIAVDCGWWPGGARYDPKDRFYNCPRLQHWIETYGMDYFATRSAPP